MPQNYTINSYQADHSGQSDLQNMENNFECLRSMFSGAGAPTNAISGMPWFDTTQTLFKIRNNANSAWLGVMCGDVNQKMMVYRNTAMDGWAIDSSVTDRVVAIKGGTTYITGGATAGSWTLPDYTLLEADIPAHTHGNSGTHTHTIEVEGTAGGLSNRILTDSWANGDRQAITTMINSSAHTHDSYGGGGSHNHGATYRPAAAVVTIQYVDI